MNQHNQVKRQLEIDPQAAKEAFGAESSETANYHLDVLKHGLWKEQVWGELSCVLSALKEMKPQGPIEAMAMAQMVMMHENFAMLLNLSKQHSPYPSEYLNDNTGRTLKCIAAARECSKTFLAGMEAINRFRICGKQQVIVSHVNIEGGAQAAFTVGGDVRGGSDAKR